MRYIIDRAGPLTKLPRTATGGYQISATLARVGVMAYPERGEVHYNTPEVLQENLDAIATAAVTNRHPKRMVDPKTFREVNCGHVVGSPTFKDGMIHATLAIQDAELIADIEAGYCQEVSMGYIAHADEAAGEFEGQSYDHVRRKIEWNHIAVVPAGRAGKDVCLCLDSADIPNGDNVMKFQVNGKEYTADSVQAGIEALEMLFSDGKGKLEELTAKVAELEGKLATATSKETVDAAVTAELARREEAKKADERKAAVQKKYPKMALDGKSQETIDALFETITAEDAEISSLAPGSQGGTPSAERTENTDAAAKPARVDPRAKMLAEARKASAAKPAAGE